MQSPFPGKDPYLEGNWWTSFHAEFIPMIAHQLMPMLRPKYIAAPERKYISGTLDEVMISTKSVPDVGIRRSKARDSQLHSTTATAIAPSARLRTRLATKVPHYRIEIRDVKERRLVTAIELLSPTNKGSGRKAYQRKRQKFLHSSAHLLEIDLHHQGQRIPLSDPYPPGAYCVLLNRARKRNWTEVWAFGLDERLPTVPVPLLRGDDDVPLDLQQAFEKVYDAGGFDLAVDYQEPPDVELSAGELEWLDRHLREAGLRK
jgi:hypothetical protein